MTGLSLAPYSFADAGGPIDLARPCEPFHDLNRGKVYWGLILPTLAGGPKLYDLSLFANHGNVAGVSAGYGFLPPVRPGGWGRLGFDGTSTILDVPHSPSIALTGDMTLSMWVSAATPGLATVLCEKGDDGTGNVSYGLGWGGAQAVQFVHGSVFVAPSSYLPVANVPFHVTAVRTVLDTTITWYINGQLNVAAAYSTAPASNTESLGIGGRGGLIAGFRFAGWVDDIAVHGRAMTAAEVLRQCQSSVARHPGALARPAETAAAAPSVNKIPWPLLIGRVA
jgi:hypothetical protein